MDVKELFQRCLDQADRVMQQVDFSQFSLPTPDTEWNVHDLVNHILYELSWVPDILSGKCIIEVGDKYDGDLATEQFLATWNHARVVANRAVTDAPLDKVIHLSYGDFSAAYYLAQEANDQCIHAWDLGTAIHEPPVFDEAVARRLYELVLPDKDGLASSGLFAPAISVPDSASTQVKLLALLGRKA